MSFAEQARSIAAVAFRQFGRDATFTAPPAGPIPCRVILRRHDPSTRIGPQFQTEVFPGGWGLSALQEEITLRPPGEDEDDTQQSFFTIDGDQLLVRTAQEDAWRTQWLCDVVIPEA